MLLLRKRSGFSLIETLVTAFIGGVILIGTGKMLSVSIQSSQTVRSSLAEQSLMWAMGKVLTDTIQCKANLKPTSGGISETNGRGTMNELIQGLGDPNIDDFTLVETGTNFKNSLDIVKMELKGSTGDPKTSTVHRDFIVYYKKKGVGTLEDKPCKSTDTDGCYFQACSLKYKLQNMSNPDVEVCDVQNCTGIAGGNHVAGIICGPGKYLKGFDSSGNKICEVLGECGANQYLKGFDSAGNKICEISQRNQSCPSGQYLSGFDNSGNKICKVSQSGQACATGQYLRGFDINGDKICENTPPVNNVTTYTNSCTSGLCGTNQISLGTHFFCVLSGVFGPGGFDTHCNVSGTVNGIWRLSLMDNTSNEYHACRALCFD